MGRVFLEYFSNNEYTFSCKFCKAHISHTDHVVMNQIETSYGECVGFTNAINTHQHICSNWTTYTTHGRFDMFDDNSILKSYTQCFYLYCKQCNSFMGWRHIDPPFEKHILLKKCIV